MVFQQISGIYHDSRGLFTSAAQIAGPLCTRECSEFFKHCHQQFLSLALRSINTPRPQFNNRSAREGCRPI
jgi:hypothetical protein